VDDRDVEMKGLGTLVDRFDIAPNHDFEAFVAVAKHDGISRTVQSSHARQKIQRIFDKFLGFVR
jgi:hypothetical protein